MEVNKNEINLDKYIQDELSGNDLKEFEALLEKDEALQKKADFHQYADSVLHDNLGEANELNPDLKLIIKNLGDKYFSEDETKIKEAIIQEETTKPSIIKRLLPFTALAAAAILLFLILPKNDIDNKLFITFYEPEKLISVQSPLDNSSNFDKANEQYDLKDYKEAKVLYEKYLIKKPKNDWALVYKGCSEMELSKIDEAMHTFRELAAKNNDFIDKANWYIALCYLKKGDQEQTSNFLNRISPNDGKYGKAQQLLKELSVKINNL